MQMKGKEKKVFSYDVEQLMLGPLAKGEPQAQGKAILNKEKFGEILLNILNLQDLSSMKREVLILKEIIQGREKDKLGILNIEVNGDTIVRRRDVLLSELNQILESQTLERARYYLKRLIRGIQVKKTSKINDIDF